MRRTIEVKNGKAYYGGRKLDDLAPTLKSHFKLRSSRVYKYVITIVEGTEYKFERGDWDYHVHKADDDKYCGLVCKKHFSKLFFVPDENKRYDITVKKVK